MSDFQFRMIRTAMRNDDKKTKIHYDAKEVQHSLQLISNGASIQVELGLNIVAIYANQNSKS